ncbi:hypothetical protein VTL71DRAFT_2268 [Oculimacula yallundae]|uniref:Uncharacterized protein n=1 Tax=Oculimacula yallundae TaxID=86028 RepID=A0ABR4C9L6_9HELO
MTGPVRRLSFEMEVNPETSFDVKAIAIIRGGPSGVATASYPAAEKHLSEISICDNEDQWEGKGTEIPFRRRSISRSSQALYTTAWK